MSSSPDPRTTTASGADVRVRFCPSPTGLPHVGLIRTVLFNWAYARHNGGKLVFRIEDTDAARDSEESYQQLLEALRWMNIDWDEGVEVGGPHAPYRQSQRHEIYREVLDKLVAAGAVYESYSTAEEIDARNEANGRAKQLGYDNFDRDLSDEQKAAFRAEGRQPAWRLRVPDHDLTYVDLIRGEVTFPGGSFPDFVLVRAGGVPLYPFVNPVDDALMGITHVLRGEDLLSSTPRQLALFDALVTLGVAEQTPAYGHLSLITGEGNKKLSKRDPQAHLFAYRDEGFLPEGLLNYLALLGWAIADDRDVFTMDEMVDAFDIARVNPQPARFDTKKAEAINAAHMRMLDLDEITHRVLPFLKDAGVVSDPVSDADAQLLEQAMPLVGERINKLTEAVDMLGFLFVDEDAFTRDPTDVEKVLDEGGREVVRASHAALAALPEWSTAAIEEALRVALVDGLGLKPRNAFGPVRVAVTGRRISPPLFESLELLGRERGLRRLEGALA